MLKAENMFPSLWDKIKQYIILPLSDIRSADIIDILILALPFYAYHFIKTAGRRLISGLILIIVFHTQLGLSDARH